MSKRVFALSKESGRKAARWIREKHSDYFLHKESVPFIEVSSRSFLILIPVDFWRLWPVVHISFFTFLCRVTLLRDHFQKMPLWLILSRRLNMIKSRKRVRFTKIYPEPTKVCQSHQPHKSDDVSLDNYTSITCSCLSSFFPQK